MHNTSDTECREQKGSINSTEIYYEAAGIQLEYRDLNLTGRGFTVHLMLH